MKSRHEILCQDGLDQFLETHFPRLSRRWDEPDSDPPDWYLELGGTCYAVEATSITEQLKIGHGTLPSPAVMTSLAQFVDEIEADAISEGSLSGAYLVDLAPIPNLRQHKHELKSRFLRYIRETQHSESAPELQLGFIGSQRVTIVKVHANAKYVAEMISLDVKTAHEAQAELAAYLRHALSTKQQKLIHIEAPVILVILDAYHYSHVADWREALSQSPERDAFFAILRVSPPDQPQLVWEASEWLTGLALSAG